MHTREPSLRIGIVGCGNISTTYLSLAPLFRGIEIRAVADLNMEAAQARAAEFGVDQAERYFAGMIEVLEHGVEAPHPS